MVLVPQHPRQKKWGFICASGFKASAWPAFAIDGNIPLTFGTSPPPAAAAPWWLRLLCGMMAGCVGVVSQLMDALHKFTLSVEHFLGGWEERQQWATFVLQLVVCFSFREVFIVRSAFLRALKTRACTITHQIIWKVFTIGSDGRFTENWTPSLCLVLCQSVSKHLFFRGNSLANGNTTL